MFQRTFIIILAAVALGPEGGASPAFRAQAPAGQSARAQERTVWFFYRVKWGSQDEFVDLFRRNHYPLLKAQLGGRLAALRTYTPTYHGDGRADWTFAVSITYRDTQAMTGPSPEAELARKLFPDQAAFRKEEQRRFELLDAHWDVPLNDLDFESPPR
ncbi:MAG: hypothetical protein LC804_09720 [Acidobacteria bacterium]|nr:hypothetical protein [Acidobacteriota bacterium]